MTARKKPTVKPEEFEVKETSDKSNDIEKGFNMETVKRLDEQFLELERDKLKQIGEFIKSETHEKTQIKLEERKVLPIIQSIAKAPFKISQGMKYDPNNPYHIPTTEDTNPNKYTIEVLGDFLKFYFEDGISVDRQGRTEVVSILKGLTNGATAPDIEIKKENKLLR